MQSRLAIRLVLACLVLLIIGGCAGRNTDGSKGPLLVPLIYKPTNPVAGTAPTLEKIHATVSVVDERENKQTIGQNVEETTPVAVITRDNAAEFLRTIVAQELRSRGATVLKEPANAKRQIVLHLLTFWTTETSTYQTQLRCRAEVLDANGAKLWEALIAAESSNFGRSLSLENYQETISNAALKLASSFAADTGFAAAARQ